MVSVSLSQVQSSLAMFAEAIAGTPVAIEVLDDDRRGWPWERGLSLFPAAFDGAPGVATPVRVPVEAGWFGDVESNRAVYRVQVLHRLAFVEFDTFVGTVAGAGRPSGRVTSAGAGSSGAVASGPVAPRDDRAVLDSVDPARVLSLFERFEELRITATVRRRYPGVGDDLDRVLVLARQTLDDAIPEQPDLIAVLDRARLGTPLEHLESTLPAADRPLLKRMLELVSDMREAGVQRADAMRAAVELAERLVAPATARRTIDEGAIVIEVEPDDETSGDDDDGFAGASFDPGSLDARAEARNDDLAGAVQAGPIDQCDALDVIRRDAVAGSSVFAAAPRKAPSSATRTFLYDEWDYLAGAHRRSWCRVLEERLHGDDLDFIVDVRGRHADLGAQIRRQFALLRPQERVRVHRRNDGDELDLDAVIEAIVDRRSGHAVDERLDIRRDRAARDVATAFLIDLSASTSSPVEPEPPLVPTDEEEFSPFGAWDDDPTPRDPGRRVIDVAKDSVALMCDALGRLGDQHAVFGFSGKGRDQVEFCVAKEFSDPASTQTWSALAAMKPLSYTRMGPAIRHASTKLAAQEARTKLLIVISDGYAQDIDYGPDRRDKAYGVHDTARALRDAQMDGIDTFCVTIDPAGNDYLRVMCPDHRYLVIDDVASLPAELAKLYLTLAAS